FGTDDSGCPTRAGRVEFHVREIWLEFERRLMKYVLMTILFAASTFAASAVSGELTAAGARSCESLASLTLPHTAITRAQAVDAGAFTPPAPANGTPVTAAAA